MDMKMKQKLYEIYPKQPIVATIGKAKLAIATIPPTISIIIYIYQDKPEVV